MKRIIPKIRLSLENNSEGRVGEEGATLLEAIGKYGTIRTAARNLSISYKHAWTILKQLQNIAGEEVIEAKRGGKGGGGRSTLTSSGRRLLGEYQRLNMGLRGVVKEEGFWESLGLKLSTRNRLRGEVVKVEKNGLSAKIKIRVEAPSVITALITREAADDLNLKAGDQVEALIKATEVIVLKRTQ